MTPIVDQLSSIPDTWALVAVGNDKRPYQPEWQKNPLTKRQLEAELAAGRAVAVGILAGAPSGGLLFVDHDGLGASEVLESLGTSLRDLPKSWAVTSGRDGRLQIIYRVPEPFWDQIKTTKLKSSVKGEQLELRWTGCQSIILGKHPSPAPTAGSKIAHPLTSPSQMRHLCCSSRCTAHQNRRH